MVRSKLWDCQDALYALVNNAVSLGKHGQVTLGNPPELMPENIWVSGQVDDWNTDWKVSGLGAKDEDFVLRISIAVIGLSADYLEARQRVEELGQDIEDAISADPTLGGLAQLAKITSFRLEDTMVDERHRGVGLNMYVSVRTWLNS